VLGNFQAPLASENHALTRRQAVNQGTTRGPPQPQMLLIMKESDIMGIIDEPVAKKKAA
jgi:hypothetical protein